MFEIPNILEYYRKVDVFKDDSSDSFDIDYEPPSKRPKRNCKFEPNDEAMESKTAPKTPTQPWSKMNMTVECYMNESNQQLWEEFQKLHGNQTNFMRHLLILDKYFRSGDLSATPNANSNAITYIRKVRYRFEAYYNIPPQPKSTYFRYVVNQLRFYLFFEWWQWMTVHLVNDRKVQMIVSDNYGFHAKLLFHCPCIFVATI